MKAIVQNGYGSPDVLALKEVAKPAIKDDQVLVRVHATSVNAGDYFSMRGSPWLVRFSTGFPKPKDTILGWDMAGRVEAVGSAMTQFQPGDAVFGAVSHAFAEYVVATASKLAPKPANRTFEPVIDRTYPFEEIPAALGYAAEGHAHGKVVITVAAPTTSS